MRWLCKKNQTDFIFIADKTIEMQIFCKNFFGKIETDI